MNHIEYQTPFTLPSLAEVPAEHREAHMLYAQAAARICVFPTKRQWDAVNAYVAWLNSPERLESERIKQLEAGFNRP